MLKSHNDMQSSLKGFQALYLRVWEEKNAYRIIGLHDQTALGMCHDNKLTCFIKMRRKYGHSECTTKQMAQEKTAFYLTVNITTEISVLEHIYKQLWR